MFLYSSKCTIYWLSHKKNSCAQQFAAKSWKLHPSILVYQNFVMGTIKAKQMCFFCLAFCIFFFLSLTFCVALSCQLKSAWNMLWKFVAVWKSSTYCPPIHKFPFSENRFCGAQDPSDLNYVHVALVCLMRLQRIYHVFVTTNSRVGTNTRISWELYEWLSGTLSSVQAL